MSLNERQPTKRAASKRTSTKRVSTRPGGNKPITLDSPEGVAAALVVLLLLSIVVPAMIPSVRDRVTTWASSAWSKVQDARPADISGITIAPEGSKHGYSRAAFGGGWAKDDLGCTTRQLIEQRDVTDPQVRGCVVLRGGFVDPYDGTSSTFTANTGGRFDVDHVVSLAEAWRSGASSWTPEQRIAYANDPAVLLLVKSTENRAKGDDDPGQWQPATAAGQCTYARKVVEIKYHYHLTMDAREAAAVQKDLDQC